MASQFKGSYKGIGQMLRADFMVVEMGRRAEKVLAVAVATAPVDPHPSARSDSGRYKDSFKASASVRGGKGRRKRAVGRVTSYDPAAFSIEMGTGTPTGARTPAHRTLGRALFAAK